MSIDLSRFRIVAAEGCERVLVLKLAGMIQRRELDVNAFGMEWRVAVFDKDTQDARTTYVPRSWFVKYNKRLGPLAWRYKDDPSARWFQPPGWSEPIEFRIREEAYNGRWRMATRGDRQARSGPAGREHTPATDRLDRLARSMT